MILTKLYDAAEVGQLNVAGLMSGSGTNLVKIVEHEQELKEERGKSPYHVAVIFSDTHKSKASEIGARFAIPVFIYDLEGFCNKRGKPIKDMATRAEYEKECMKVLNEYECAVAAYAGYMRKATSVFVNSFLGINVHPADLTIKNPDETPKYRGDHAVRDAIRAGEKELRSTTHIVAQNVDCGQVLMVSAPVPVYWPTREVDKNYPGREQIMNDKHQNRLKEVGDWVIFPRTLEYIADGKFARDEDKRLYFDGKHIPQGVRLETA